MVEKQPPPPPPNLIASAKASLKPVKPDLQHDLDKKTRPIEQPHDLKTNRIHQFISKFNNPTTNPPPKPPNTHKPIPIKKKTPKAQTPNKPRPNTQPISQFMTKPVAKTIAHNTQYINPNKPSQTTNPHPNPANKVNPTNTQTHTCIPSHTQTHTYTQINAEKPTPHPLKQVPPKSNPTTQQPNNTPEEPTPNPWTDVDGRSEGSEVRLKINIWKKRCEEEKKPIEEEVPKKGRAKPTKTPKVATPTTVSKSKSIVKKKGSDSQSIVKYLRPKNLNSMTPSNDDPLTLVTTVVGSKNISDGKNKKIGKKNEAGGRAEQQLGTE